MSRHDDHYDTLLNPGEARTVVARHGHPGVGPMASLAAPFERMTSHLFKRKSVVLEPTGAATGIGPTHAAAPTRSPSHLTTGRRRQLRHLPGAIESWVTQRMGLTSSRARLPSRWTPTERKSVSLARSTGRSSTSSVRHPHLTLPTRADTSRPSRVPSALTLFQAQHSSEGDCPSSKRLCTPVQESFANDDIMSGATVAAQSPGMYLDTLSKLPSLSVPAQSDSALPCHSGFEVHSDPLYIPPSPYSDASTETLFSAASPPAADLQPDTDTAAASDRARRREVADRFDDIERDCIARMRETEGTYTPDPHYMRHHPDLNRNMRPILVDWLLEVGADFHLHRSTVHVSINLLDRFLSSCRSVTRDIVQCIATACLSLAIKLEEYTCPKLKELTSLGIGAFDVTQLKRAEHIVLKGLKWKLTPSTTQHWLPVYFHRAAGLRPQSACRTAGVEVAAAATAPKPAHFDPAIHRQPYRPDLCPLTPHMPQYPTEWYLYASDVTDATMHYNHSLVYSYAALAAAGFYMSLCRFCPEVLRDPSFLFQVTGHTLTDLADCLAFVECCAGPLVTKVSHDHPNAQTRYGPRHTKHQRDELHSYQTHHPAWLDFIQPSKDKDRAPVPVA
ncbi:Cyclin-A1 [Tieghemiomyces parasiticus]|uniref:Cyclin-A1 n=1 Tax=Tieghemiomyces parasiticus TaxID=78921 RepID=A0A9W7ZVU6_9FUNG|nr:Cyclin-A1 [Tieghemiomyces parasiticus]